MLRRPHTILATVGIIAVFVAPASGARQSRAQALTPANALETAVLSQMNVVRARRGLRPLRITISLSQAADQHCRSMARRGYFSHNSANGTPFWRRIQGYYPAAGFRYWSVGENLLWSSPSVDAASALRMWMQSPEHRANLLNRGWRDVGVAAVHAPSAPGVYGGRRVTIVTTDFGVRVR